MNLRCLHVLTTVLLLPLPTAVHARDYEFEGTITRTTLENYLSRSITMLDLLTGQGNLDDNIRMLKNVGAKFTHLRKKMDKARIVTKTRTKKK